jgi:hypothetical protein
MTGIGPSPLRPAPCKNCSMPYIIRLGQAGCRLRLTWHTHSETALCSMCLSSRPAQPSRTPCQPFSTRDFVLHKTTSWKLLCTTVYISTSYSSEKQGRPMHHSLLHCRSRCGHSTDNSRHVFLTNTAYGLVPKREHQMNTHQEPLEFPWL